MRPQTTITPVRLGEDYVADTPELGRYAPSFADDIRSHGVAVQSRHENWGEIQKMVEFCRLLFLQNQAPFIRSVWCDSNVGYYFICRNPIEIPDFVRDEIAQAASLYFTQFRFDGEEFSFPDGDKDA